ncbi:MAG: restriction endonuclease [Candidatus Poribacteria bacterium]|nr:restriction endonuclease [Candidatus Poribacteria bacterium]
MNSRQNGARYEEFCRLFLAEKLEIPIDRIQSRRIPSKTHPDLPKYDNQIDFYWEYQKDLTLYKNFADAKWRGRSKKVTLGDIRNLQQVKEDIDAHKAMMITNTGFTRYAKGFAENHGIALHIVRPEFDIAMLHHTNRETMQTQIQEFFSNSEKPYIHEIVHRAFDFGTVGTAQTSASNKTVSYTKDIKQAPMNRMQRTRSHRRQTTSTQKVTGGQGGSRTGRQGGPPSGRQGGSGPSKGTRHTRGGGTSNRSR